MQERFMTTLIRELAAERGASVLIEPDTYKCAGLIRFKSGKQTFFLQSFFDLNGLAASKVADDKHAAAFFLRQFGYPVPEGRIFFHHRDRRPDDEDDKRALHARMLDEAYAYARSLGLPVIAKPNNLAQGRMVSLVGTKRELFALGRQIFQKDSSILVQRFYPGNDYRVMVLDDHVVAAFQRRPLEVRGDGVSTLRQLMAAREAEFERLGRPFKFAFDDQRVAFKLRRSRLSADSVIPAGACVPLLDNANLSTGGEAVDLTERIHPEFASLCARISRDMGLRLCGVDIIAPDLTAPPGEYVVIEINRSPGLTVFATMGPKQRQIVRDTYAAVLQKLEDAA